MRNSSKIIFIICSIMLLSGICLRLTLPSSTPLRLKQQPPTQSILLLPLDSRPVCSTMVQKLGALAGLNVILPPKACLDNYRTPSDRQKLLQWLQTNQPKYDYSIISADNLLHGGLLAARMNTAAPAEEDALLEQLRQLTPKNSRPFFSHTASACQRPAFTGPLVSIPADALFPACRHGAHHRQLRPYAGAAPHRS